MKLFVDTANLRDIADALEIGVSGITTNPSLLAKEPKGNYIEHIKKIVKLAERHANISLSIEVFSNEPEEMLRQAEEFNDKLNYKHLAVKIPVSYRGKDNLAVIRELVRRGITVNCTACMAPLQAALAARAGSHFVSLFYNRIRDAGNENEEKEKAIREGSVEELDFNPENVVRETKLLLQGLPEAEIIIGSIRTPLDIKKAFLAGAHIVTASYKIIQNSLQHFKTDDAVDKFLKDFSSWMG